MSQDMILEKFCCNPHCNKRFNMTVPQNFMNINSGSHRTILAVSGYSDKAAQEEGWIVYPDRWFCCSDCEVGCAFAYEANEAYE